MIRIPILEERMGDCCWPDKAKWEYIVVVQIGTCNRNFVIKGIHVFTEIIIYLLRNTPHRFTNNPTFYSTPSHHELLDLGARSTPVPGLLTRIPRATSSKSSILRSCSSSKCRNLTIICACERITSCCDASVCCWTWMVWASDAIMSS
jgi:hypothetical protein